jgi:hypothetical protein
MDAVPVVKPCRKVETVTVELGLEPVIVSTNDNPTGMPFTTTPREAVTR